MSDQPVSDLYCRRCPNDPIGEKSFNVGQLSFHTQLQSHTLGLPSEFE